MNEPVAVFFGSLKNQLRSFLRVDKRCIYVI
jgi:hypothetical protein